jgi:hypothetical protein
MQDEGVGESVSSFDADSFGYVESDFIDLTFIPPPPPVTGPVKVTSSYESTEPLPCSQSNSRANFLH